MAIAVSPEKQITTQVLALLRADVNLTGLFSPIRLLENPTRDAFLSYGVNTLTIQPFNVKAVDHPSGRSTSLLGLMISAFVPNEQGEEDSTLFGLDLGSYLRSLLWGYAVNPPSPGVNLTFATTEFRQLTPLIGEHGATKILSYQAIFETDIDPRANDFSA